MIADISSGDVEGQLDEMVSSLMVFESSLQSLLVSSLKVNPSLYSSSFFVFGAAKRALALSSGFRAHIKARNALCALSLVRLQLDTALRLEAAKLSGDPEQFARDLMAGKQINRMFSVTGERMTDKYLHETLSRQHPWVTTVYTNTSGYVHLSERHIFSTMYGVEEETRTIQMRIAADDSHLPASDFLEMVFFFSEICKLIIKAIHDWLATQALTALVST